MVYHALFHHSHLSYVLILWGHAANCKEVLELQKSVRIMTSSGHLDHDLYHLTCAG